MNFPSYPVLSDDDDEPQPEQIAPTQPEPATPTQQPRTSKTDESQPEPIAPTPQPRTTKINNITRIIDKQKKQINKLIQTLSDDSLYKLRYEILDLLKKQLEVIEIISNLS